MMEELMQEMLAWLMMEELMLLVLAWLVLLMEELLL